MRIVHVDARRDEGVDVVCNLADPQRSPRPSGLEPAHAVLASNLLEHVLNRDLVLTRIKRLTRPGGIIVVTVPNLSGSTKTRSIRCIVRPTASWKPSSR